MAEKDIDMKKLRRKLKDECWAACIGGGMGIAAIDAMEIDKMSDEEVIEMAKKWGVR